MTPIVKIDGAAIDVADFIRVLKLTGQYEGLIEQLVRDRLTVQAAKKMGLRVPEAEIQERADQFRRVRGLHRAADTNKYLDAMRVSMDEFEAFIIDSLYQEKMMERVCSDQAIDSYFKLNSPKFDSIEISHMVLDAEGKAKEMISVLNEDPGCFDEMAREHSIAVGRSARCCGARCGPTSKPRSSMLPSAICSGLSCRATERCSRSSVSMPSIRPDSTTTPAPRSSACCARTGCALGPKST
jgi:hypothetical protein